MNSKRILALVSLVLCFTLLGQGCAAPTPAAPTRLVLAEVGDWPDLNPFSTTLHVLAHRALFDTLVIYNTDYDGFEPNLAESWAIAPDSQAITFTLRPGMTFSDGTLVDAEAIKRNFDYYRSRDENTPISPQSDVLGDLLVEVQVVNTRTVVLQLAEPYAPLFDFLNILEMMSPTAFAAAGAENFGTQPVGSGPWVLKEQTPNSALLFARNPLYAWGPPFVTNPGAPYPAELQIKYFKDVNAAYLALQTGEVQIAPIPADAVAEAQQNPNLKLELASTAGLEYLGFNTEQPPFNDKQVRLAIAYAVQREALVAIAYNGLAKPVYGPLAPTEFGYSAVVEEQAKAESNSLAQAQALLAAAGWQDTDGDGILEKDGETLEFELLAASAPETQQMATALQAQLAPAGIRVNIRLTDVPAIKEATIAGTHEMFLLYFNLTDPRILSFLFHSNNIGSTNRTRYANAELDELLDAADAELDPELRKQKVATVLELLVAERPFVPLLSAQGYMGYRQDLVGGLIFDSLGGLYLNDAYLLPSPTP